jgi:hypothetical protein
LWWFETGDQARRMLKGRVTGLNRVRRKGKAVDVEDGEGEVEEDIV